MSNSREPAFVTPAAHAAMLNLVNGYRATQLMRVAARFSFAEHLAQEPKTAEEIAAAESLSAVATFRILRLCASHGLVTSDDGVRFTGTPLLATLAKDVPGSLRGYALTMGAPLTWLPWGRLVDSVRTGQPEAVNALGSDIWTYLAGHPDELTDAIESLTGSSLVISREVARVLDTSNATLAVDVGGSSGSLVRALLEANPRLRGTVFDLPSVVVLARGEIERAGLQDRLSVVGGDFFDSVPEGDLHLLRFILHDWDDEASARILRNVRRAARPGASIVILETVIGRIGEAPAASSMDVNMMVGLGGRERTLAEYSTLLEAAGYRVVESAPLSAPLTVVPVTLIRAVATTT